MKDISKIPKWAQTEIQRLERDNKDLEKKIATMNGEGKSNVYIQNSLNDPIPLPKDSHIIFVVDEERELYNQIVVSLSGNGIEIRGTRGLKVRPNVSNSINVEQDKDR